MPDTTPTPPPTLPTPTPANPDPLNTQQQPGPASNAQASNAQPTPTTQQTPAAQQPSQPSKQPNLSQQPQGTQQPSGTPAMATNTLPPAAQASIQRAGVLRTIAQTLAGGPRYKQSIDPVTGKTQYDPIPLSRGDIGMAIVAEVLSGAMSGLSVKNGPGNEGRAAAAGFNQAVQSRQQADQQQAQQAKDDLDQQTQTLAKRAAIFEANSRTLLNTSEAEQQGADAIDKLADINRQSGVLDISPDLLDNGGQPMTQAELNDAMKSGKLSATDQLGPVAGRTEVTNPDGSKRWEATHLIVKDPNSPIALTQDMWDRYAAGGVKGFPAGTKIGQNAQVPLRVVANANEQLASHYLANQRLVDLRNVLEGTQYADKIPQNIDFSKPGVDTALQRYSTYVSHNADNLNDPFLALQAMGAAKRHPRTGQMMPNPDAKYVDAAAQAMGGWSVLEAAHNQILANKKAAADLSVIDTDAKATAVLAAPKWFSQDQIAAATRFHQLSEAEGAEKATREARARAQAEGTDVQAMYRFGKNPVTGETLNLNNAAPSMLVDANGTVIPQDLVSTYKPTAQQRQTADTARQVLAISAGLQQELQKNPNLAGPLSGRSKAAIAKLGYGDKQAQQFLDDLSFLQTAATKMHTSRFSNQILDKMGDLIKAGMNADQFTGALASINSVASRYADEDKLTTVANYKRTTATPQNPHLSTGRQVQIPAGAQIGRDGSGNVVGYRLNGKYVSLNGGNQ